MDIFAQELYVDEKCENILEINIFLCPNPGA